MPTKQHRPNYHPRIQVTRTKFKDNAGVQADWIYLMDANKTNFDKTPVSSTRFIDLGTAGAIPEYDRTWDGRPNPKRNVPFTLPNTLAFGTGPRNDRFIMDLAENERGTEDITIYTTDIILSALLTVKNSVFPWDLTVIKEGNQIFIEPSEKNKANYVDILTVNENTASDLPEDEKEMLRLCIESTNVNKKFIELTTKGTEVKDFSAGKAADLAEVPERKVYRYRKWILDNKINVVVRSEADAYITEGDNTPFIKVCALNECMSQNDWKQNVELNRGALISSELRNNLCKICKWLCQAYLTECNTFKIGFVTKPNAKEPKYSILTVEDMSTTTLSNTQGFRMKDSWSIIKTVADVMSKYEDGVYSFVKLPYKQGIRIYQVPDKEENQES
jgi:translation initiation factor 3 subunit D